MPGAGRDHGAHGRGQQLGRGGGGVGPAEHLVSAAFVAGGSDGGVDADGAGGEDQGVFAGAG